MAHREPHEPPAHLRERPDVDVVLLGVVRQDEVLQGDLDLRRDERGRVGSRGGAVVVRVWGWGWEWLNCQDEVIRGDLDLWGNEDGARVWLG